MIVGIAFVYKFQPSEIYELTVKQFLFWFDGINKVNKWRE